MHRLFGRRYLYGFFSHNSMHDFLKNTAAFFDEKFFSGLFRYGIFFFAAVGISEIARQTDTLMRFDSALLIFIASFRTETLTAVMRAITFLGSLPFVMTGAALALIFFALRRRAIYFAAFFLSVGGAAVIVAVLKHLFRRARPAITALSAESGFSFPSGHAILALAFWGILIYFSLQRARTRFMKRLLIFAGASLVIVICFSRVYLGVHWPTDVIASGAIGGAWLLFVIAETERKLHSPM